VICAIGTGLEIMGNPEFENMSPKNQKGWLEWKEDLKRFREIKATMPEWYTLNDYFASKDKAKNR